MASLLGAFEQAVLIAVVRLAGDAYGRAILNGVQAGMDRAISAGAIYATLDRLEQQGMLDSRLEEGTPVRGGRSRRYYQLTAQGVQALNESKAAFEKMWGGMSWPMEAGA